MRWVFKHQPLPFHRDALRAHIAAEAARRQGRFWEMHDRLMAHQDRLDDASLAAHAAAFGLDLARWRADVADPAVYLAVLADREAGLRVGASGTPTLFVNGRVVLGDVPIEEFAAVIDDEIARADRLRGAGVPAGAVRAELTRGALSDKPDGPMARRDVPAGDSPVRGDPAAPVTVVVFASFEDRYCAAAQDALRRLLQTHAGKARVVFKHFLQRFHDRAPLAHGFAVAAHEQGRFWELHDRLFAAPAALDRVSLETHASAVGLDLARVRDTIDSGRARDAIARDDELAKSLERLDSPTFYVNGRRLLGAQPYDVLAAAVDAALGEARPPAR